MGGWNKGKMLVNWEQKVRDKFNGSFELVSVGETDYKGDRLITVRCLHCGSTKDFSSVSFRGNHGKHGHCESCSDIRSELILARARAARSMESKIRKQKTKVKKERQKVGKKLKVKQIGFKFCKGCNAAVIPSNRTYCDSCNEMREHEQRKKQWRQKDINRRLKLKEVKSDRGITLEKLYQRDNDICYLCGQSCNWNDYEIINGAFVVGGSYPSVEHIIALCNGGSHTWNNIKLACHACNSKKGRKILAS